MEPPRTFPTPSAPAPKPAPKKAAPVQGIPEFPPGKVAVRSHVEPAQVLLGDRFVLIVDVKHPAGHKVVLPEGVSWGELESAGSVERTVTTVPDGVVESFRFPLQAFKLGDVETPEMQLTIPDLEAPEAALKVNPLAVTVVKLAKPDEELEPAPNAPAMPLLREDPRFLAWPPLLLLQGILFVLVRYLDRRRPAAAVMTPRLRPRPTVAAHLHALNQLEALKRSGLIEKGRTAEFVDTAVQICREYLELSYDVPVLESTTEEAMGVLAPAVVRATMDPARRRLGRLPMDGLRKTLSYADRVKFAKLEPGVGDCARVLEEVARVVEGTRPEDAAAPQPEVSG